MENTEGARLMGGRTAERKLDVENAMLGVSAVVVESMEWDNAGETSKLLEDIEVMGAKLKS